VLVEIAKVLGLFSNGLPALKDLIVGAALRILLCTTLLLEIVQRRQQRTFIFGNAL